jgi:hypothetical protein
MDGHAVAHGRTSKGQLFVAVQVVATTPTMAEAPYVILWHETAEGRFVFNTKPGENPLAWVSPARDDEQFLSELLQVGHIKGQAINFIGQAQPLDIKLIYDASKAKPRQKARTFGNLLEAFNGQGTAEDPVEFTYKAAAVNSWVVRFNKVDYVKRTAFDENNAVLATSIRLFGGRLVAALKDNKWVDSAGREIASTATAW